MKKIKLLFCTLLLMGASTLGNKGWALTQDQINGGTLPEVSIKCSRHSVSVELSAEPGGVGVGMTLNFIVIECTNGFWDIIWD